jgi:NitT/TauT family transport system ATP-binding protein
MTPGDALLQLRGATFSIGAQVILENIDLEISAGEFVCVVGPSGCGKTTMLRLLAGLLAPTSGAASYKGAAVVGPQQDIALVFQDYGRALLPWRNAAGNVALALEATGVPRPERAARIGELLKKVGLAGQDAKFPAEMSGGMQQRLQIARCLAQNPAVLLMDEPFGSLDAMTRQGLQDEILAIVAQSSATGFFVTHDIEEAIYLADRVIALLPRPGRIGASFTIDLPRPRNQLSTREHPEFLRLRRELLDFVGGLEA